MAILSHIPTIQNAEIVIMTNDRYCRKTIFIMKFNLLKFSKKIFSTIFLNKEVTIAFLLISLPILYPKTVNAGLFSFLSNITGDEVSAKTIDIQTAPNSQNISVLQAAVNYDPNPNKSSDSIAMISGNALVAEIGPSGTVSDIENENTNTQISLYTVRKDDTLSDIAKMFDVSVNTIIWANNLERNTAIKEGDTLIILPISGIKYTVKRGDTIKGIAVKYKSDLNEILLYNDLTLSSVLTPGDVIIIPDAEPDANLTTKTILSRKTNTNTTRNTNGPYYPGYYIRPIDGGHKSQGIHGYNGVDLAAPIGTPIHAAASGIVIRSVTGGWHGGYGNYVVISHPNGTQTLYAHTLKNFVQVGDNVEQGQMIAKIGLTGRTTGPHVHFEVRGAKNSF